MNTFITKNNPIFRNIGWVFDSPELKENFSLLWQTKQYANALELFPKKWKWYGEDIANEKVCDNPLVVGMGYVFSKKAFELIHSIFPNETSLHHEFSIDGYDFVWFSPPIVEKSKYTESEHNIFIVKPGYSGLFSEKFVKIWQTNGFVGNSYIPYDGDDYAFLRW